MKCPRCEKEFQFEYTDTLKWLKNSRLDNEQLSFILFNYGGPICDECLEDLKSAYYASGINPYMKP